MYIFTRFIKKRTEIFGTCIHRNKYKLKNCDTKD